MTIVMEYVKTLIPVNWRSSPGGWTSGNCPMCIHNGESRPDTKSRGGFMFAEDKFQYNCFNCEYKTGWAAGGRISGRLEKLLKQLGATDNDIQRLKLEILREADVADLLIRKERKETMVIDWPEMELPENCDTFMNYSEPDKDWIAAATYLTDRSFDIKDKRFMFSTSGDHTKGRMNKRFVLPFYYKGKVVGYTGRWVGNPPDKVPKYYNKQPPKNFVYGLDRQTQDKQIVIVTEGILDAIVTDGVAIGSNNINEDQANVIDKLNKRVILLPDADKAGMSTIKRALQQGWEVSFPEWMDCKDASDAMQKYGRLYTVRSIIENAVKNPTKIQVMAKSYCQ